MACLCESRGLRWVAYGLSGRGAAPEVDIIDLSSERHLLSGIWIHFVLQRSKR